MGATEQELKELLRKYYAGDTSLEEERLLQQIFQPSYTGDQLRRGESFYAEDQAQFLYFQSKHEDGAPASLSAELERLMQSEPGPRVWHRQKIWRVAAMLLMFIGIGWVLSERYLSSTTLEGTGPTSRFNLPDGSVIWLSEGSTLSYGRDFNEDRREVSLKGEGYFEVRRDEARPFMIHTSAVTTEVLGTAFNLRAKPDEKTVELSVAEGKVLFGADTRTEIRAGESATFDEMTWRVSTDQINPNATAWKIRTLDFKDARLRTVFRDLARYYEVKVKVENPKLLNCRVTAHFEDVPLEQVFRVLSMFTEVTYVVEGDTYVIRGKSFCN